MKNIKTLLWILNLMSVSLFAQEKDLKDLYTDFTTVINSVLLTQQGSMEVSGFLSYNYLNTKLKDGGDWTNSITQLEPQLSYFVVDNLSLGLQISYTYEKTELNYIDMTNISEQTLIGPIAKFYFGEEKLRPFIFTDYLLLMGDGDGGELDFGAGLFYHVTGNFGINLFGKYGILWTKEDNIDSQNRIFIGVGITNFIL